MVSDSMELKEKIGELYVEQFKKELNILERAMLLPLYSKMKKIFASSESLEDIEKIGDIEDLGFWRNIVGLFPYLSNRVLDYLKEKCIELSAAETRGELESLYNNIVHGRANGLDGIGGGNSGDLDGEEIENRDDEESVEDGGGIGGSYSTNSIENNHTGGDVGGTENDDSNTGNGVSTLAETVGAGALLEMGTLDAKYHYNKKLSSEIIEIVDDANKYQHTKDVMERSAEQLEHMAKNPKLDGATKAHYEKYSKIYRDAAKTMDPQMIKILEDFDKLENMGMTMEEISRMSLSLKPELLKSLGKLNDTQLDELFDKIKNGTDDEIKTLFKQMTNQNLPDPVLKQMKKAKHVENLKNFTRTLSKIDHVKYFKLCRALKSIAVLDVVFAGLDVYFFIDKMKEAELIAKTNEIRAKYKRQQAYAEFSIGAAAFVSTAIVIGVATGPVGRICGGICAASFFVYEGVEYYFDEKDYYAQNFTDYIRQERTKVKQSIYTHVKGENCNEKYGEKDSWQALFMWEGLYDLNSELNYQELHSLASYQEHKDKTPVQYANTLEGEEKEIFQKAYKKMEKIIKIKMEYIDKLKKKGDPRLGKNMKYKDIGDIAAEANTYYHMKSKCIEYMVDQDYGDDINDYKSKFEAKLKKDSKTAYDKLDHLYHRDQAQFWMLYDAMRYFKQRSESNGESGYYQDENKRTNIEYVLNFGEFKKIGKSIEDRQYLCKDEGGLQPHDISTFDVDLRRGELIANDINNIDRVPNYNKEELVNYLQYASINNPQEYYHTPSTFQTIIYKIARNIHGYDGENDMRSLMRFYSEEKKDEHGFYFSDKGIWCVNNTGIDVDMKHQLDLDAIEITSSNIDSVISDMFFQNVADLSAYTDGYDAKPKIDTYGNTCDDELTDDINSEIYKVAKEVLSYKISGNREKLEKEIEAYVKNQSRKISEDGSMGYVYLPQSIVESSIIAGIGDVSKFLYKYDTDLNTVVMVSTGNNAGKCNFNYISVGAEVLGKSIDLGSDVKSLIKKVDDLTDRIDKLVDKESNVLSFLQDKNKKDELNIPASVREVISDKIVEWIGVRDSFEYCGFDAKSRILNKISEFYDYFTKLYVGILAKITEFSLSNDLDKISYWNDIFAIGNDIFELEGKDGNKKVKDIKIPMNKKIKEYYLPIILQLRYISEDKTLKDKTIENLIIDGDKRGYYFVLESLIICLENLLYKNNGGISQGAGKMRDQKSIFSDKNVLKDINMELVELCEKPNFQSLYEKGYQSFKKIEKEPDICRITKQEKDIHVNGQVLLDDIIKTNKDAYDWRQERGNIKFEWKESESKPDGSIIVGNIISRGGNKTKIKYEKGKIKIDGISKNFTDVTEGLRTANLINFLKREAKKYPRGKKVGLMGTYRCYKWSSAGDLERNVDYGHNTNMLDSSTAQSKFSTIYKDENFMKELNTIIFGISTS